MFDHFYGFSELLLPQAFLCLLNCLAQNQHQLIVVALIVLEVLHKLEVLSQQVTVIGQVVKVVFDELFGVLVVLIVPDYKSTILNQDIGQSLKVTVVHGEQIVVEFLSHCVVFFPDLELNVPLVCLQRCIYLAYLFVHLPRLAWVLTLLQVAPVEKEFLAELDEESFVVPENAEHFRVLIGFVLQVVEHFIPQLKIVSLSHQ